MPRAPVALLCFAVAAVCLVVARAHVQSVTLDEADSYLLFAGESWPSQWYPSSGNHVLNSALAKFVTAVFPLSELTARVPAIAGAILYIGSAFYLCLLVTDRKLLRFSLFICLVCNPMVLDYLVAARGYSLAVGFLMAAIAVIAGAMSAGNDDGLRHKCAWVSVLLALSCAANFSFAIANGITLLMFFWWAGRRAGYARMAPVCFLPGIAAGLVAGGAVALEYPKSQLYFGSHSLVEMWNGITAASFDELNPEVVNPMLLLPLSKIQEVLPYIAVLTAVMLFAGVEIGRSQNRGADWLLALMRLLAGIAVLTLLAHWIAFHTIHLLLPKSRTGLFFVPLCTLIFGVALSLRFRWWGAVVLMLMGVYFLGCLRLSYFKEWKFDGDVKPVYWILNDLNHRCGFTEFATDWRYGSPLNFYRRVYANSTLPAFTGLSMPFPTNKDVYVLNFPTTEDFIRKQELKVVYHNEQTDTVVAIRECGAGARPAGSTKP